MKRYILILLTLIASMASYIHGGVYSVDMIPNVQVQDSTRLVSNPDGILTDTAESRINNILRNIRSVTTAQVVLVVVDDIEPSDIDDFATELFDKWGIGHDDKDNGLLILVAKDSHQYVFRTGYGLEGVLTDVRLARIGRNTLVPAFRKGDYDGALIAATTQIEEYLTDPDIADEIRSGEKGYGNKAEDEDWASIFMYYLAFSALIAFALALVVVIKLYDLRGKDRHEKYTALVSIGKIAMMGAIFTLGLTLIVALPLKVALKHWRDGEHRCPNCDAPMTKVDEEHDNDYLTPAQDTEERLNSVDYDVWLCPQCGERDIYAFVNDQTAYTECPLCRARTMHLLRDRILVKPTEKREGQGVKEYACSNCRKTVSVPYTIEKTISAAPLIIGGLGAMGGGKGGGFGGGIGGGFGGGMTGGGGASGKW